MVKILYYRCGECRNNPKALSHTYAECDDGNLYPMCKYGWNRENGYRISIFRGTPGTQGDCKICACNIRLGRQPVIHGFEHKTRWL
jgi:hypothetical protein